MTETRIVTREQLAAAIEDRIDLPAIIKPEFVTTFVDTIWPALPQPAPAADGVPRTPDGEALIAHTRNQVRTVIACLDSLSGLWRLQVCPDPSAHGEAEAAQPSPGLDVDLLHDAIYLAGLELVEKGKYDVGPAVSGSARIAAEYARLRGSA